MPASRPRRSADGLRKARSRSPSPGANPGCPNSVRLRSGSAVKLRRRGGDMMPDRFVPLSKGQFWTGTNWADDPAQAVSFSASTCRDPWAECQRLCAELERSSGRNCARTSSPEKRKVVSRATP